MNETIKQLGKNKDKIFIDSKINSENNKIIVWRI